MSYTAAMAGSIFQAVNNYSLKDATLAQGGITKKEINDLADALIEQNKGNRGDVTIAMFEKDYIKWRRVIKNNNFVNRLKRKYE